MSTLDASSSRAQPKDVKIACFLVHQEGESAGTSVAAHPLPYIVGKHEECNLVLPGEGIMRRHARIYAKGNEFAIADLATYQGTFLNGQAVVDSPIRDGDIIRIGGHKLRVSLREMEGAAVLAEKPDTGPALGERIGTALRGVGTGSWVVAGLAVLLLGIGLTIRMRHDEQERIRTQHVEIDSVSLVEGESRIVELKGIAGVTVAGPTIAAAEQVPQGVSLEALNAGTTEVTCRIKDQGTRFFQVVVKRPADPLDKYPELQGIRTLGIFDRTKKAQEFYDQADREYAAREDDLANRMRALRGYTLAAAALETLEERTTLLDDARAKKKSIEAELDRLWEQHYSQLQQAAGVGDNKRARDEAFLLTQIFPDGSGKRNQIARVYFDTLK